MRTHDRSEGQPENGNSSYPTSSGGFKESSAMQKRLRRLSRNMSEAIASLKNSLNLDLVRDLPGSGQPTGKAENCRNHVWGCVVRSLTQLYPGSQLPDKLVSNIRKHYDSLPLSYSQVRFEMKDVFLHMKLIEQATEEDHPAIMIHEESNDEEICSLFKVTFACNSTISWSALSGAFDSASVCFKKIQIFEKKGFTLGIIVFLVQAGQERMFRTRIENALKAASKKPKSTIKLPFGLCGCQEENARSREQEETDEDHVEQNFRNRSGSCSPKIQLKKPLPNNSIKVSVDEWQTVQSCSDDTGNWLLNSDCLEFADQIGPNTFKGVYKGKKVRIEKLKGCDKGNAYEFELREDLLELMTCGHKNILQFYGVCIDDREGLCVLTKLMDGGSVQDLMLRSKKLQTKEILRISADVAEAMRFMNDHGVSYRDLNTQRILLDKHGNACLGDMGIVVACKSSGEAMEYETDGYRWLAPEIIAADPESVTETWMSNVYSFGMVIWEMVAGEIAYSAYSPVQAAVGIAACGLRPDIPADCPQILRTLMTKCWNSCPSRRPQFSEIHSTLTRALNNTAR